MRRYNSRLALLFMGLAYAAIILIGLGLAGCASGPAAKAHNDPLEPANRAVFAFNIRLDKAVARPVARFYVSAVPSFMRTGVHNVLENLDKPVTLGNDILQGEGHRAGQTLTRMVTNTTLGLGGLIDVATMAGVPDHSEDFGQTLGVWGVGGNPYLMLPFMGPSSPRDLAGAAADYFSDPLVYAHYHYENLANGLRAGFGVLDMRASTLDATDQIERTSLDYYAATRSFYRQYRESEIRNGNDDDLPPDDNDGQ